MTRGGYQQDDCLSRRGDEDSSSNIDFRVTSVLCLRLYAFLPTTLPGIAALERSDKVRPDGVVLVITRPQNMKSNSREKGRKRNQNEI